MSVGFSGEFDDNINTTTTDRQSGFRESATGVLQATVPREQTFFRARYQYQASYTADQIGAKLDQAHIFDTLLSHTFSPRLVLDISDALRKAVEPGLVENQQGQQVELRRRGDYLYNEANAALSYTLSHRWIATLRGGWGLWRYDEPTVANDNDRTYYRGGFDLVHGLDQRTFAGISYQYNVSDYTNPGTNDTRNSMSHSFYLTFAHTFGPRLSANINAGAELREFGDGTTQQSPNLSTSINYTLAPGSQASLGFQYAISTTEVGTFRSSDTANLFGRVNYLVTRKLTAGVNGLYSINTFQNPLPGATFVGPVPKGEEVYSLGLSIGYQFTQWARGALNYNYDRLSSDIQGRSFFRNRVGLGLTLSY